MATPPATDGVGRWFGPLPVLALGAVVGLTALAHSARWFWLGDIACHFRWQLGLVALAVGGGCAAWRRPRLALAATALAVLNLAPSARLYLAPRDEPAPGPSLVLGCANVLWSNRAKDEVCDWIRAERPDVLAVLELNAAWRAELSTLEDLYPYQVFFPEDPAAWDHRTWGRALIARIPLHEPRVVQTVGQHWPALEARVDLAGRSLLVRAAHPPRPGAGWRVDRRNRSLAALGELAWPPGSALVGDLNTSAQAPCFADLIRRSGLRDSRRGFGRQATFVAELDRHLPLVPLSLSVPLDHVLVGSDVAVLDRWTRRLIGSDHRAVLTRLAWR